MQMFMESALIVFFALLLDTLLGEPRRFHPLVGFGFCAAKLEALLNKNKASSAQARYSGAGALMLLLIPALLFIAFIPLLIKLTPLAVAVLEISVLYLALGRKSLMLHAQNVIDALHTDNLLLARRKVALIVSRDTGQIQKNDIIKATIESVVENSNDAIFGAIFWFLIGGAPAVLAYRLVNTLDAMWGYKNERFIYFGWAAARLDDVFNWLPARLTVLSFAVYARSFQLLRMSFQQGRQCASANAGPVMAAGACALGVKLGGDAFYQGKKIRKPGLGFGNEPQAADIQRAMRLVNGTLILWLLVVAAGLLLIEVLCA